MLIHFHMKTCDIVWGGGRVEVAPPLYDVSFLLSPKVQDGFRTTDSSSTATDAWNLESDLIP